jgi:hypothetical protein
MKKIILNKEEIVSFMKTEWKLYASEHRNGKLNRFWFNGCGEFKVTCGNEFTYTTKDLDKAIEVFNNL